LVQRVTNKLYVEQITENLKNKKVEEILKKSKIKAEPRDLSKENLPETIIETNQRYKSKAAMTVISIPK
jgi:hypothetical protein